MVFLEKFRSFGCRFRCLGFEFENTGIFDGQMDFA
jgi:hypothetical protein